MEWQPIETAPKDGTSFLGWDGKYVTEMIWASHEDDDGHVGWCCAGFSYGGVLYDLHYTPLGEPTHWKPLPEPPS